MAFGGLEISNSEAFCFSMIYSIMKSKNQEVVDYIIKLDGEMKDDDMSVM